MATYSVSLPVVLHVSCLVEADSEDAAIEAALDGFEGMRSISADYEIIDGEALRKVVTGNVYHGCIREAEATEEP